MIIPNAKRLEIKFTASQRDLFEATKERLEAQGFKWLMGNDRDPETTERSGQYALREKHWEKDYFGDYKIEKIITLTLLKRETW